MDRSSPWNTIDTLIDARARKDLSAAYDCYEPTATVVLAPGKFGVGEATIKSFIESVSNMVLSFQSHQYVETRELAIHLSTYQLDSGNGQIVTGRTADVLRRGTDGIWRIVLDNAWAQ